MRGQVRADKASLPCSFTIFSFGVKNPEQLAYQEKRERQMTVGQYRMMMLGAVAAAVMLAPTGARAQSQDPSTIVGLKLKNRPSPDVEGHASENNWSSVKLETADLSYRDFCHAMKAKGVNALTLRIANDLQEFTGTPTWDDLYTEFGEFIDAAYKQDLKIYLWQRRWFTNDKVDDTVANIKGIVAKTRSINPNATAAIAGIIITESNLTGGASMRNNAIRFARMINQEVGLTDFLKRRTLVFPGGEMGAYFQDIRSGLNSGSDYHEFYQKIDAETGYFAWSFKHFGRFTHDPDYAEDKSGQEKSAYIRAPDGLGLDELSALVNWGRNNGYAAQSHVIFWGDDADTVANMTAEDRWAVKDVMVTRKGWTGYFFNLAIAKQGMSYYDINRKVTFYNPNGSTYTGPNQLIPNDGPDTKNKGPGQLYSAWMNWRD